MNEIKVAEIVRNAVADGAIAHRERVAGRETDNCAVIADDATRHFHRAAFSPGEETGPMHALWQA